MAVQWVKAPLLTHLTNSLARNHMVEVENHFPRVIPSPHEDFCDMTAHRSHTHTHHRSDGDDDDEDDDDEKAFSF